MKNFVVCLQAIFSNIFNLQMMNIICERFTENVEKVPFFQIGVRHWHSNIRQIELVYQGPTCHQSYGS